MLIRITRCGPIGRRGNSPAETNQVASSLAPSLPNNTPMGRVSLIRPIPQGSRRGALVSIGSLFFLRTGWLDRSGYIRISKSMKKQPPKIPTADELRQTIVDLADAHSKRTGMTLPQIGYEIAKDRSLIDDVRAGRNVTVNLFEKITRWFLQAGGG